MATRPDFWEILANYESSQLLRRQFQAKHGRSLGAAKAQEICAAFTQGRGYMRSAQGSDRIVRPLLAYYGVLSLSRGLTLFLLPLLREAGLAQAHGLSVEAWGDELGRAGGSVASLRIRINAHGTLRQLIEATGHQSYLRNNCSSPNSVVRNDTPSPDAALSLVDALSRLPEIREVFARWRDDRNMVRIWPQKLRSDGSRELRVDAPYTMEDVRAVFGDALALLSEQETAITVRAPPDTNIPSLSDTGGHWNVGELVAMSKFPSGIELSKIALAFVVSYAIGMLVRYYPSHWVAMFQNRRHDDAMPTLLAALQHVEEEFPRFVVEFLEPPKSLPSPETAEQAATS